MQRINWAVRRRTLEQPLLAGGTLLWLAMIHGANGLRTIINDYPERDPDPVLGRPRCMVATVFTIALGTLVIFTFDPNIS